MEQNITTLNNPWQTWKDITPIEQNAIDAVIRARELVIASLPTDRLVAIYIKGSFVRREMKEESDVDMVPIVVGNEDQNPIWQVNDAHIAPVMVVPLSLWELQHNELFSKSDEVIDLRAKPDALLWDFHAGVLMRIYGNPLDLKMFSARTPLRAFIDEIAVIRDGYVPAYRGGRMTFSTLLKEVFWLTKFEQSMKGAQPSHSFDAIAHSVTDQKHIIHQALELRTHPDESKQESFIRELEQHLAYLQKNIEY